MADKNDSLKSNTGFLKPLIIAAIIIIVAWIIGKGFLTLVSFTKQM
nr:hypothetical protein [Candidatus Omnitrophota bacterium]